MRARVCDGTLLEDSPVRLRFDEREATMTRRQHERFLDREDAGRQLAQLLAGRKLYDPLVLAIPRGGVVIGAVLAKELGAELDVVLSRKLRAPQQPELGIGAVAEDGRVHLSTQVRCTPGASDLYLGEETLLQLAEIARCKERYRAARPAARIAGRSVIVTDDGIATGATMIAALRTTRDQRPLELIVAVPVADAAAMAGIRPWCDEVVCLTTRGALRAVGMQYVVFEPVNDTQIVELLCEQRLGRRPGQAAG